MLKSGIVWRISGYARRGERPAPPSSFASRRGFDIVQLQYGGDSGKRWFNPTKGYGFIQPVDGGRDVFVHISAVERAGLNTLNEGQTVEYEEVANKGKTSAENLKVAGQ
jgi:cold shock protein